MDNPCQEFGSGYPDASRCVLCGLTVAEHPPQMTVYAVFREGIYRHECVGVFSSQDKAEDAARAAAALERDGYHQFQVHPFELDVAYNTAAEPDAVAEFRKPGG